MRKTAVLITGCMLCGTAYSIIPISTLPIYDATIDLDKISQFFQNTIHDQERYEKGMKELKNLDLNDKKAVITFATSYPEQIPELKKAISLHH